ncbi:MAG: hypothetical protein KA362_04785 [Chloroflexi bacterium]|nr:hypothetical protein [Chloroflexota bacterium]
MLNTQTITNPILRTCDNLRDPAIHRIKDGYSLFYTRYANGTWDCAENWSVAWRFTRDFITFTGDRDITPKNYASPGEVIWWHGRFILPFQSYPVMPQKLYFAESGDGLSWSEPRSFLEQVLTLPWNLDKRAIDPSFVLLGKELHCFFVGSDGYLNQSPDRANLLGHAMTTDPHLQEWQILSHSQPLMGRDRAPDGVENVVIYRTGDKWTMLFSEGLADQHLALAQSDDLLTWEHFGQVQIAPQQWLSKKYGAPFVWQEQEQYFMVLMGEENVTGKTTFGFLVSSNGLHWTAVRES